jgi:hypothetical protein
MYAVGVAQTRMASARYHMARIAELADDDYFAIRYHKDRAQEDRSAASSVMLPYRMAFLEIMRDRREAIADTRVELTSGI